MHIEKACKKVKNKCNEIIKMINFYDITKRKYKRT